MSNNKEEPFFNSDDDSRRPFEGVDDGRPDEHSPEEIADQSWERRVIEKMLMENIREQKRRRRWGIFFKTLVFGYLLVVLLQLLPPLWEDKGLALGAHSALIDVKGVIADGSEASADNIIEGLRAAYKDKSTRGVILRINSPGGSPVQAGYVFDEIRRLRKEHKNIPLYAVITDIGASGAYYIAAASDKIYANKSSMIGSIGVLINGFGFVGTMKKLGIERRLLTAGEHKGFLDPFSPLREDDASHVQSMLDNIHLQFIEAVKTGRGDRLADDDKLFSGLVWTGEQGVGLGLVDGLASVDFVARKIIGAEKIVDYSVRPPYFERLVDRFGTAMAQAIEGHVSRLSLMLQ